MRWNEHYGMWFDQIPSRRAGGALRAVIADLLDRPPHHTWRVGWGRYGAAPGIPATTRRRIRRRAEETLQQPERATTSFYWTSP